MNTTNDIRKRFPQWQFSIRDAHEVLNTRLYERTDEDIEKLNARAESRIAGRNLYFVLKNIFGIPMETPNLTRNYYTVDGYWFALKDTSVPDEDERQPLYVATSNVPKSAQMVTFTLYMGKVIADPAYPDWPRQRILVGREVHLHNTTYTRLRAELAELIDELDAAYEAQLPRYQAWKVLEVTPAETQDYLMQLIRKALREMPAREVLPAAEPVEVPQAVQEDDKACMDGLLLAGAEQSEDITLAALDASANRLIALLDDFGPPNFEPFDPTDAPDDDEYEEDDEDDDSGDEFDEPPYPDQDPAAKPHNTDEDDRDYDDDETESPDLDADATEPDTVKEPAAV